MLKQRLQVVEDVAELRDKINRLEALVARYVPQDGGGSSSSKATPLAQRQQQSQSWKRKACSTLTFTLALCYFLWVQVLARGAVGGGGRALTLVPSSSLSSSTSSSSSSSSSTAKRAAKGKGLDGSKNSSMSSAGSCDPLAPFKPGDLPPDPKLYTGTLTGRSLYTTVITADHTDVLLENWPSQEEFLYKPWDNHFMLAVPERDGAMVAAVVTGKLGWHKVMDFTPPQRTYPCEGSVDEVDFPASGWYRSQLNVTVLFVVRKFRRPAFIDNATFEDLAKPCGLLKCCQKDGSDAHRALEEWEVKQSTEFSTINLAFVHHLLVDMALVDNYDYVFKLDADIRFHREPPGNPGRIMQDTGCVIMQSEILEVGSHLHCIQPLLNTMGIYAKHHGIPIQSKKHGWCEQMNLYMYGNFVGFWRPFVRAPAQRSFSRWLFENDRLYYNYNDQGSTRAYLCMWYDVPYLNSVPWVCDFLSWRGSVFSHP